MQDEIVVQASFQGMYDEAFTQLTQVVGTDDAPDVQMLPGAMQRELLDLGVVVPMQEFVEAEGYDTSGFQEIILREYTVEGTLYSMPLAASGPVLFYNKDAFAEAGLDPEDPPQTFSEIHEAAQTLVDSGVVDYGLSFRTDGGAPVEILSNQGELLTDNDNGRSAPPEQAVFNSEAGVEAMTWIAELHEDGLLGNFGRSHDDARAPWYAGDAAMILDTSAATAIHVNEATFEVGAGYVPVPDDAEPLGPAVGGASLWIFDNGSEDLESAAFEFVKYLLEPEVQARWAANTGYFPVTSASYDEPALSEQLEEVPALQVANDQVAEATVTPASLSVVSGVQIPPHIADAWERVYDGGDPQEELDRAAEEVTSSLESYNRAN